MIAKKGLSVENNNPNATMQTYEVLVTRNNVETSLVKYSLPSVVQTGLGPMFALYSGLINDKILFFVYGYQSNLYISQTQIGPNNTFTNIKRNVLSEVGAGLVVSCRIYVTDTGTIEISVKDVNKREMLFKQDESGDFKQK